ncbi:MAG: DNA-3-methyladenine glycosylase [bacterium]|nr:DNA-3-methyladenine glycosylase [bacterium]
MQTVLTRNFFSRPVLDVAPDLLGAFLVRHSGKVTTAFMINEVEAYDGPNDKACHAHRGRTVRTEVMFGEAGRWYVYFVYGMHDMLNIVTGDVGYPSAVLIRGVMSEGARIDGPGRVTKALNITRALNAKRAVPTSCLWIEDRGVRVPKANIVCAPRIGVDYAAEWKDKPYRFLLS